MFFLLQTFIQLDLLLHPQEVPPAGHERMQVWDLHFLRPSFIYCLYLQHTLKHTDTHKHTLAVAHMLISDQPDYWVFTCTLLCEAMVTMTTRPAWNSLTAIHFSLRSMFPSPCLPQILPGCPPMHVTVALEKLAKWPLCSRSSPFFHPHSAASPVVPFTHIVPTFLPTCCKDPPQIHFIGS